MSSRSAEFVSSNEPVSSSESSAVGRDQSDIPTIDVESVLTVLDDRDCRALLEATTESMLTAQELADQCDIPRSTTYRKVERLSDAGLLEERIRLRSDGKHATEYGLAVEALVVSISELDGLEIEASNEE